MKNRLFAIILGFVVLCSAHRASHALYASSDVEALALSVFQGIWVPLYVDPLPSDLIMVSRIGRPGGSGETGPLLVTIRGHEQVWAVDTKEYAGYEEVYVNKEAVGVRVTSRVGMNNVTNKINSYKSIVFTIPIADEDIDRIVQSSALLAILAPNLSISMMRAVSSNSVIRWIADERGVPLRGDSVEVYGAERACTMHYVRIARAESLDKICSILNTDISVLHLDMLKITGVELKDLPTTVRHLVLECAQSEISLSDVTDAVNRLILLDSLSVDMNPMSIGVPQILRFGTRCRLRSLEFGLFSEEDLRIQLSSSSLLPVSLEVLSILNVVMNVESIQSSRLVYLGLSGAELTCRSEWSKDKATLLGVSVLGSITHGRLQRYAAEGFTLSKRLEEYVSDIAQGLVLLGNVRCDAVARHVKWIVALHGPSLRTELDLSCRTYAFPAPGKSLKDYRADTVVFVSDSLGKSLSESTYRNVVLVLDDWTDGFSSVMCAIVSYEHNITSIWRPPRIIRDSPSNRLSDREEGVESGFQASNRSQTDDRRLLRH